MERMWPSGQHLGIPHLLRTPSLSFFIYEWGYLPHESTLMVHRRHTGGTQAALAYAVQVPNGKLESDGLKKSPAHLRESLQGWTKGPSLALEVQFHVGPQPLGAKGCHSSSGNPGVLATQREAVRGMEKTGLHTSACLFPRGCLCLSFAGGGG